MRSTNRDLATCLALIWILGSIILVIPSTSATVTELQVAPDIADPGDTITISGKASPGEEVWVSSSFEISLPVSAGEYSRKFKDIYFPAGNKRFTVTAEQVKDIRIALWLFTLMPPLKYPLDGPKTAKDDSATISISLPLTINGDEVDVSGKKDVEVYGAALDGATSVILDTKSELQVTANSNGDFSLEIDTGGIPEGEFVISAGGIKKTVYLGVTPPPTPTPSPTSGNDGGGSGDGGTMPTPTRSTTPTASTSPLPSGSPSPATTPTPSISPMPSGSPGPTATPTTIVTPVPTGSPTSAPTAKQGISGFELILALAGLCVVAHWLWRRRR